MIAVAEEEPQRAAKLFAAAEAMRQNGSQTTDEEEAEEDAIHESIPRHAPRSGVQCALGRRQVHDDGAGDPIGVELRY